MAETNANPFAAYDIAVKIKNCIEPFLEGTTKGLPERSCVHAGAIAWDNCECGQLIVSWQDGTESTGSPTDQGPRDRRACGPPLFTLNYSIVMLRCAPQGKNDKPPKCEQIDAAARVTIEDAWAVRAGVICCLNDMTKTRLPNGTTEIVGFVVGTQVTVGPDGLCQGTQLPVTVTIKNGCYPCDGS